jgi:hypothetical protein
VILSGVLTKYNGDSTVVEIPESVTAIGERAFYDCAQLETVIIRSLNIKKSVVEQPAWTQRLRTDSRRSEEVVPPRSKELEASAGERA